MLWKMELPASPFAGPSSRMDTETFTRLPPCPNDPSAQSLELSRRAIRGVFLPWVHGQRRMALSVCIQAFQKGLLPATPKRFIAL